MGEVEFYCRRVDEQRFAVRIDSKFEGLGFKVDIVREDLAESCVRVVVARVVAFRVKARGAVAFLG